jgi:hypothetical protein
LSVVAAAAFVVGVAGNTVVVVVDILEVAIHNPVVEGEHSPVVVEGHSLVVVEGHSPVAVVAPDQRRVVVLLLSPIQK